MSVNGAQTGSYIAREDQKNARNAIVIEQNSSVLFQLSGPKAQMTDFFDKFGYCRKTACRQPCPLCGLLE